MFAIAHSSLASAFVLCSVLVLVIVYLYRKNWPSTIFDAKSYRRHLGHEGYLVSWNKVKRFDHSVDMKRTLWVARVSHVNCDHIDTVERSNRKLIAAIEEAVNVLDAKILAQQPKKETWID